MAAPEVGVTVTPAVGSGRQLKYIGQYTTYDSEQ